MQQSIKFIIKYGKGLQSMAASGKSQVQISKFRCETNQAYEDL